MTFGVCVRKVCWSDGYDDDVASQIKALGKEFLRTLPAARQRLLETQKRERACLSRSKPGLIVTIESRPHWTVTLEGLSFPATVYAHLIEGQDGEHDLIWSRNKPNAA